jgi:hypothetical protein
MSPISSTEDGRPPRQRSAICYLPCDPALIAHGMFEGERIPRPIETAVWSTFEIVVKSMIFAGNTFLPTSGTPAVIARRVGLPQTRLLSVTVPAGKVRKLWPAAKQTAAAQARCREYLVSQMKQSLDRAPKSTVKNF